MRYWISHVTPWTGKDGDCVHLMQVVLIRNPREHPIDLEDWPGVEINLGADPGVRNWTIATMGDHTLFGENPTFSASDLHYSWMFCSSAGGGSGISAENLSARTAGAWQSAGEPR